MCTYYIILCVHYIIWDTHYLVCTIYWLCADILVFSEYMILVCPCIVLVGAHIINFFSNICHYQRYVYNIIIDYIVVFVLKTGWILNLKIWGTFHKGHAAYQVRSWSNSIDKTDWGHLCLWEEIENIPPFSLIQKWRWISQVYWPLVQFNLVISK